MKINTTLIVAVVVSLIIGGILGLFSQQKPKLTLSSNAQKIVECFPTVGGLYGANFPAGPTYILNPSDKSVIGVVYMTETKEQVESVLKDRFISLKNIGLDVDHVDFKFWSKGHGGYEQPHFDIYFYSVPHELHDTIKC